METGPSLEVCQGDIPVAAFLPVWVSLAISAVFVSSLRVEISHSLRWQLGWF